jgi:hypothetical protein
VVVPERVASGSADKSLAELKTKYRDNPVKLSAEALGLPVTELRPLRPGSKWGLPA